jgi:CrcB protein
MGQGAFPWGTFTVNVVGSIALGIIAGLMAMVWSPSPELRVFLIVGVLSSFTTFSAYSLDLVLLIERGRLDLAALYLGATIFLAVGGLFAGLRLTRILLT